MHTNMSWFCLFTLNLPKFEILFGKQTLLIGSVEVRMAVRVKMTMGQ